MKSFASVAGFVAVMALCAATARAQDPAHFKVELENDRARVLHVTVEPVCGELLISPESAIRHTHVAPKESHFPIRRPR